ncbi:MAG: twin-arginine translocase TatA/TatE family subunit [Euzebyales bacterium]|nr:twin-arginine translocase TatA/TatE family subunit [Euzebyales bacterium]
MNAPGFWEMAFLAVLALLIFGPERLPKLARSAGEAIAAIKREASGTLDELKRASDFDDVKAVADDLRSTTAELKRSTQLSGPMTSDERPEKPRDAVMKTVTAQGPAPFDPDAP